MKMCALLPRIRCPEVVTYYVLFELIKEMSLNLDCVLLCLSIANSFILRHVRNSAASFALGNVLSPLAARIPSKLFQAWEVIDLTKLWGNLL